MIKQILLYVPVIHSGYERLLGANLDAQEILLLDESFVGMFPRMKKEIRALPADHVVRYLRARYNGVHIRTVALSEMPTAIMADNLIVPNEDIMRELVGHFELDQKCSVQYEMTFLRWDREWSRLGKPPSYTGTVSKTVLDRSLMADAAEASERSSDWWRQVGALLVRDSETLRMSANMHVPSEYAPYINGDPRNDFSRGIEPGLSTAIHAEANLIGWAAKQGVSLNGCEMYVTTFPCPSCAYLIAAAGLKRLYFAGGYSMLDGDSILRQAGVELVFVDMT